MFKKRCHFCNEKFKSQHVEKIKSDEYDDGVFACRDCIKTYALKKPEGTSGEIEIDVNHPFDLAEVTTIINNTSALINLFYTEAQIVDTKLFVSKKNKDKKKNKEQNKNEFSPVVTKDKQKPILRNHIRLKIELSLSHKLMTNWNKPTTDFDVHDNFGNGYSLTIAFAEPDNALMKSIMPTVRECGFGPIPGKQWAHCHFHEQNPTSEKAEVLFAKVANAITNELKKFVKVNEMNAEGSTTTPAGLGDKKSTIL